MANSSAKVNKGIRTSRRNKIIMGSVIAVIVLIIIGFFINIAGLPQKLLTAEKVILKNEDGSTAEVISKVKVSELAYHYYQVVSTYGTGIDEESLDQVYDEETGKTYRDLIIDYAASEVMNMKFVNKAAEDNGFLEHSGAGRYAEIVIDNQRDLVENTYSQLYNISTLDRFLSMQYPNAGISVSTYRKILRETALTEEYQAYVQQFELLPSEEEIKADFEKDPSNYQRVDINMYFFNNGIDSSDETITDEQKTEAQAEAVAKAQAVVDKASDPDAFKAAVMEQLEGDEDKLSMFTDDYDPTYVEGVYKERANYYGEDVAEFLLSTGEVGEAKVIETENGAYAFLINKKYVDETPAVVYRTLTLINHETTLDGATQEEQDKATEELIKKAESIMKTGMTPLEFSDLVKENSDYPTELLSGGFRNSSSSFYYNGITEKNYQTIFDSADAVQASIDADPNYELTDEDKGNILNAEIGHWIFSSDRKNGDFLIKASADGSMVTIYYIERIVPQWMYSYMISKITTGTTTWSGTVVPDNAGYVVDYKLMERYLKNS